MGFMTPGAEYFKLADLVQVVACERCEMCGSEVTEINVVTSGEGYFRCTACDPPEEGWYGNLSAAGYMDRTDYMGPYPTADEAIEAVMEQFEVDEDGDMLDEEN